MICVSPPPQHWGVHSNVGFEILCSHSNEMSECHPQLGFSQTLAGNNAINFPERIKYSMFSVLGHNLKYEFLYIKMITKVINNSGQTSKHNEGSFDMRGRS